MPAKVVVQSTALAIDEAGEPMRRLVEFWGTPSRPSAPDAA
jgi:hypothetical protein